MRTGYVRIWRLPDAGGKTGSWKETFFFSKNEKFKETKSQK